jgi:hypothetical protein
MNNHKEKLEAWEKRNVQIYRLYRKGRMRKSALARAFNLSPARVASIIKNRERIQKGKRMRSGADYNNWVRLRRDNLLDEAAAVKAPPEIMAIRLETIPMSVRPANCLKRSGMECVGDLVQKTERELLLLGNFGRKSLKEIKDILERLGLHLKPEPRQFCRYSVPREIYNKYFDEAVG